MGKGATFIVTLPVHQPAMLAACRRFGSRRGPSRDRCGAHGVLLVEDDEEARDLVKLTLERAGASVEAVSNTAMRGARCSRTLRTCWISDIRMPEEDGAELLRSLRGAGVDTPAIALTAYARRQDAEDARAAGFQIHPPPVDAARLVEAVARLLRDQNVH